MRRLLRIGLIVATWLVPTAALAGTVGFAKAEVPDGSNPPIEVGFWYPTRAEPSPTRVGLLTQTLAQDAPLAGRHLPLVVVAHGQGGEFAGHSDTAFALAEAGFVVAAPTFNGDNYRDQSRALDVAGRVRQFSAVVDWTVTTWHQGAVDGRRIGAFGFSAGGLTVLIAAGGRPDLGRIGPYCTAHPAFFDCRLIATHRVSSGQPAGDWPSERKFRAIVVAAPALGFAFDASGLQAVNMPVQLWRAADDTILPAPFYADAVRSALPHTPEFHVVSNAGHFDFLAPCSAALARVAPVVCASQPGFDRVSFHAVFDADIVAFFVRNL